MKRVCLLLALLVCSTAQATPPNFLFIVVDDLNVALGSYGHPTAVTPHIDELARRGVRFDRAYVQYPLCNPSRASFLSGLRPDTTRVYAGNTLPRHAVGDVRMLPEFFADHGYFTARVGKITHDRFPDSVSWNVSEEAPSNPYYMPGVDHSEVRDNTWIPGADDGLTRLEILEHLGRGSGLPLVWRATDQQDADTPDGGTALRIIELLRERAHDRASGETQPFFIAAGFHKPHQPWIAPDSYFQRHPIARVGLPEQVENDLDDVPGVAYRLFADDVAHSPDQVRQARAAYHATVSLVDTQVGIIMAELAALDLADNTIVVLFSDHGFHLGEHGGLWRKVSLFEESTRVPLIVMVPGGQQSASSSALVELVDLYPTLAELAGLPIPANLEGTSFAPLLDSPKRIWKSAVFSEIVRGASHGRSIRTARYRYTEWRSGETVAFELYDLQEDPGEFINLARSEHHAERLLLLGEVLAGGWQAARPYPR